MQRLIDVLEQRTTPLRLFFRDDDAGWQQDRLDALLDLFLERETPIDLAVIPAALTTGGAADLIAWQSRHNRIGLHQHGYAHLNHEPAGVRKCEFGPARPIDRQCADIAMGRDRLQAMLDNVDPIFTPPWNRCLPETVAMLPQLGFAIFSDDGKTKPDGDVPAHAPVALDWERKRNEARLGDALFNLLAGPESSAGIMLHHATMDAGALVELSQFLSIVRCHERVEFVSMRDLMEPVSCTN